MKRSRYSRTLRFLSSQKRALSILLVTVLSLLLGLFCSDFYTKGEPREAMVAQAMMESGNYVLPRVYGSEFAYKPPMTHWLMIASSILTGGEITEVSARLPSAIALVVLVMATFLFFDARVRQRTSYLTAFVLLTTFEVHRAGISARVDMLLTLFIVLTLFALYKWEERGLKGLPLYIPLLISAGILTKGPVAVVLPLLIFFVYLILATRYPVGRILGKLLSVGLLSLVLPSIWYYAAWRMGGSAFLMTALAENAMRFLHIQPESLHYPLGHSKPALYVFVYLASGALPWTLLLFFLPWHKKQFFQMPRYRALAKVSNARFRRLEGLPKVYLFSFFVVVVTLVFYMLPSSKRSVYLLPLFPFLALFVAEGLIRLAQWGRKRLVAFSGLVGSVGLLVSLLLLVLMYSETTFGISDPKLLHTLESIRAGLQAHTALSWILVLGLIITVMAIVYQVYRKGFVKLVYCNVLVLYFLHLNIDGPVMMGFKEEHSAKRFAKVVQPIVGSEVYSVSRLREGITNLYGLALYANLRPLPFDEIRPESGYLIIWEKDLDEVRERFFGGYELELVVSDVAPIQEGGLALLMWFERKGEAPEEL